MGKTVTAVEMIDDSGPHFRVVNSDGTSEEIRINHESVAVTGWSKLERLCKKLGIDVPNDTSQLVGCSYKEIA